jgi:hypothetical protein
MTADVRPVSIAYCDGDGRQSKVKREAGAQMTVRDSAALANIAPAAAGDNGKEAGCVKVVGRS